MNATVAALSSVSQSAIQSTGVNYSSLTNATNQLLCGLPGFCDISALTKCANVTLVACPLCSMVGAGFFGLSVILLGLSILCANGFVIFCTLMKRSGFTGQYGAIKTSMAVADFLTGWLIWKQNSKVLRTLVKHWLAIITKLEYIYENGMARQLCTSNINMPYIHLIAIEKKYFRFW